MERTSRAELVLAHKLKDHRSMAIIPSMSKRHFIYIAEVIKTLPPECRVLVTWKFARALMGTNKDFHMDKFITACGSDMEIIVRDLRL
jgi:hypothetical protein